MSDTVVRVRLRALRPFYLPCMSPSLRIIHNGEPIVIVDDDTEPTDVGIGHDERFFTRRRIAKDDRLEMDPIDGDFAYITKAGWAEEVEE